MKKLLMCLLFFVTNVALAWQPTKIVDVVVPFPPGSGNDVIARTLTEAMSRNSGGTVKYNIVNRPGAGGVVGNTYFTQQPNDGHTIAVLSVGGIAAMDSTFPVFREKPPYDLSSFTFVSSLGNSPNSIIANINDPVNTPEDLVRALTTEKVVVAESGAANKLGLDSVLLYTDAKNKNPNLVRVEHKGPAESVSDVVGGHVRFASMPLSVSYAHHKANKLKVVALTQPNSVSELNLRGFGNINKNINVDVSWCLALPKNTPRNIVEWYKTEITKAFLDDKVKSVYATNMYLVPPSNLQNPDNFTKWIINYEKFHKPVVDIIIKNIKN